MRLYVTGGTGLVGSNVIKVSQDRYNAEVIASLYGPPPTVPIAYTLDPLDIRNHAQIAATLRNYKPDVVIHCAGLIDMPFLNKQRPFAWSFMVEGTRAFAYACREIGARLIFVSSDWVFDGRQPPVDEDTPPCPVNFYGVMKVASERELSVMDGLNYAVGRLAGVYGFNYAIPTMTRATQTNGLADFPNYVADRLSKGQRAEIWATDRVNLSGNPTLGTDGADMLLRLAQHTATGIYHCFGSEAMSRPAVARHVAELFGADPGLVVETATDPQALAEWGDIGVPFRTDATTTKTAQTLRHSAYNVMDGLRAFKQAWDREARSGA